MMHRRILVSVALSALLAGCLGNPDGRTLSELHAVEPDLAEVQIEDGLEQAMQAYRSFLEETPESKLTPEAMRRLADLQLEKQFGILGDGQAAPAPEKSEHARLAPPAKAAPRSETPRSAPAAAVAPPAADESDREFERRATQASGDVPASAQEELDLPPGEKVEWSGPEEAIALYDQILATYPDYEHNDQVLYQKARAYDELGRNDDAIVVIEELVARYPHSRYVDEVQFRRGEYFFMRRKYLDAEESYGAVTAMGPVSPYYELALYKLGWTFYKQELHEEALQQYLALLDYKVSTGYDFDQSQSEDEERRIADTYRVISLSFSALGGPDAITSWFAANGSRSYEARIYSHLGEFYLEKRRYYDAAGAYQAFVSLYPLHRRAPHFGMRVVEIYEAGGFPRLVLDSKKDFAVTYGLQAEYWQHFDPAEAPEVLAWLKGNLADLANHYHAQYQEPKRPEEKPAHFREALHWYRAYLASFPQDPETPAVHYQLADLLLEEKDFDQAALAYEQTAYDYPDHAQAAAAGYAAIYAHRESQKAAAESRKQIAQRAAVDSTLRFVNRFPKHERAAAVLGLALEDLYAMKDFELAISTSRRLLDDYPDAELEIRRSAWAVTAHASFDLARYEPAELAYARVLELTPESDESRQGVVENLAASIYKRGEEANAAQDHRGAADHFLRIAQVAPSSKIRPVAEYDAGAALIRLEDWSAAAGVLETFRDSHPQHELEPEATKQLAFVHRKQGNLARAAEEYERIGRESQDEELRRESQLLAGELYLESGAPQRALAVYLGYVEQFPRPLELAVETRFKISEIQREQGDEKASRDQLREIVALDRKAGAERSERVRFLAAKSALVLSEDFFHRFQQVALVQPFEKSLAKKQRRLDEALNAFESLVDYEVGEVTAGATFYIAELYYDFSQALMSSERPSDLSAGELQDYEMVLEEEAFPFEERSIEVHEKNLELLDAGVYNGWIEKSLAKLAVLMPGRYAKFETSSGWIDSLDRYAYRTPGAAAPPASETPEAGSGEAPATPEPEAESARSEPGAGTAEAA